MPYEERTYRTWARADDFTPTTVCQGESDLMILAETDVSHEAASLLAEVREDLTYYILRDNRFHASFVPHAPFEDAPPVARRMATAAEKFGVGPMAAVAGAVAEYVGAGLAKKFGNVVVENGGDIFVCSSRPVTFGLFAGEHSPFTGKLRFRVTGGRKRYGVCTSSGTVGHSLSFGKADAVCVVCGNAVDADAAATAFANRVQTRDDVDRVVAWAENHKDIGGIIIAKDDRIGLWGTVEII